MSPELLNIKEIPSFINYKVAYFSFGYLILYGLSGDDNLLNDNEKTIQERIPKETQINSSDYSNSSFPRYRPRMTWGGEEELITRDKTCVISANDYDECDAAHIVPLVKSNNYDIDNGLLLNKTLHDSFDKHYWCIDPHTLRVILNKSKLSDRKFSCTKYDNILVNIQPNKKMLKNLKKRYEMFIENV